MTPPDTHRAIGLALAAVTAVTAVLGGWAERRRARRVLPVPPPPEPEWVCLLVRYDDGFVKQRAYPLPPAITPVSWDDASALVPALPSEAAQ